MHISADSIGTSVDADTLRELRNHLLLRGYESDFLLTKLDFQEVKHALSQYFIHFAACVKCGQFPDEHKEVRHKFQAPERIYPNMLPTQVDGRWSITNPPMITINKEYRDVLILPDPGTAWICWDWDALYAKIAACYADDQEDLEAFEQGWDIHTITACRMIGLELPPSLVDPHTDPSCAAWRVKHNWKGKDDIRRTLAKVRYCLLFGRDERAVEGSQYEKDMVKLGLDRTILKRAGKQFLAAKPKLVACKRKWWEECARTGVARTILGRKRILSGQYWDKAKTGWAHMFQGLEADMLNLALIKITGLSPSFRLVYPSHDAGKIAVPLQAVTNGQKEQTIKTFKDIVERDWTINHNTFKATATWYIRYADGSKANV